VRLASAELWLGPCNFGLCLRDGFGRSLCSLSAFLCGLPFILVGYDVDDSVSYSQLSPCRWLSGCISSPALSSVPPNHVLTASSACGFLLEASYGLGTQVAEHSEALSSVLGTRK
jgi:hypothetical protein